MPADPKDKSPSTQAPQPPQEKEPGLKEGSVVDEYIDDSFPASDPPSFTPGTGSGRPDDAGKPQKPADR
jgi:hypothetical protein